MPQPPGASALVWLYMLLARGGFWRAQPRLDGAAPALSEWPAVVAVVPARNEADVVGRSLASVLQQDYPGAFSVILVDDDSSDGTAAVATATAAMHSQGGRLTVTPARPLPSGWAGKLWALSEGVERAAEIAPAAPYVWFTDADIEHDPASLRRLVAQAEQDDRDMVSVMVMLTCRGVWERLLIPPFVFFFQMLYPFAWANRPGHPTAAAAGGCIVLRRDALERAGGLASIRDALIDDCTLAARIKRAGRPAGGRIWIGLTRALHSIRPYDRLGDIWRMVARSAYAQLNHSPLLIIGALVGMVLTYVIPPALVLTAPWHGARLATALAGAAWLMMAVVVLPTLSLYRQSPAWAPVLPIAALLYCAMTVTSAVDYARGHGGRWKGRTEATAGRAGRPGPPQASSKSGKR